MLVYYRVSSWQFRWNMTFIWNSWPIHLSIDSHYKPPWWPWVAPGWPLGGPTCPWPLPPWSTSPSPSSLQGFAHRSTGPRALAARPSSHFAKLLGVSAGFHMSGNSHIKMRGTSPFHAKISWKFISKWMIWTLPPNPVGWWAFSHWNSLPGHPWPWWWKNPFPETLW